VPGITAKDIAIYGEPLFAHHVAQTLGYALQEPTIDWLPKLSPAWRGRDVQLTSLGEARKITRQAFFKPADEKCFDAKVYQSGLDLPASGLLREDLPVLVQEIVEWQVEFRCFVLNREVVTISPYWRDGKLAKTEAGTWPASEEELNTAKGFCERVLLDQSVMIPEAVVIDVGYIAHSGWAVIESNAAFASGIYGCEAAKVLPLLLHTSKLAANFSTEK